MNEATRHNALQTASAIEAVGAALHADRYEQISFDLIGGSILALHAEDSIDFEGFCPLYPDLHGMSEAERAEALISYAIEWIGHWVHPNCETECIRYSMSRHIAERLTAEIARIRYLHPFRNL